mmetsp:Transcript_62729/g.101485  ORF Transcript_62729/g.101485 Transcript_62729/m.101485 type:complete len:166 (+) Transcript_62729:392-889(+)
MPPRTDCGRMGYTAILSTETLDILVLCLVSAVALELFSAALNDEGAKARFSQGCPRENSLEECVAERTAAGFCDMTRPVDDVGAKARRRHTHSVASCEASANDNVGSIRSKANNGRIRLRNGRRRRLDIAATSSSGAVRCTGEQDCIALEVVVLKGKRSNSRVCP